MATWWHYLLLANLYLVLFYVFYALLLKRETFFQLNRIYLVASAALSFVLPAIQSDWVKHWLITERVEQTIYQVNPAQLFQVTALPDDRLTLGDLLIYIYLFGLLFMAVKLGLQLMALRKLLNKPESHAAYSFFNKIQVSETQPAYDIITAHEETHSRQLHSADRLLLEVLLIISWFNPVIYLYRRAVKHLHEFIADEEVISTGTSKKQYAQLLVNQAFMAPPHQLINPFFNKSLLKQRIIMLQKNKSKRVALVKYGLSAPLFAAMLVLSSATLSKSQLITQINFKTDAALDVPAADAAKLVTAAPARVNAVTVNKPVVPKRTTLYLTLQQPKPVIDTVPENKSEVFSAVEQSPAFVGGMGEFYRYLGRTIHYPAKARETGIQGRVVVSFIVEKDGSLSDVKALRGPGYGLDEEAIRAIISSPKWVAGRQNDKPVRTQYIVPVQFSLPYAKQPPAAGNSTDASKSSNNKALNEVSTVSYDSKQGATSSGNENNLQDVRAKITLEGPDRPLYIVDGKEESSIKEIKADDIESISVLKSTSEANKYGEKGKNGVVIVTTKKKP